MADDRLQKTRDSYCDEHKVLDEALNRHSAQMPARPSTSPYWGFESEAANVQFWKEWGRRVSEEFAQVQRRAHLRKFSPEVLIRLQDLQMEHDESRTP